MRNTAFSGQKAPFAFQWHFNVTFVFLDVSDHVGSDTASYTYIDTDISPNPEGFTCRERQIACVFASDSVISSTKQM